MAERGYVKWYNEARGYGVIVDEEGGETLFVHYSEITESDQLWLAPGEEVDFDRDQGEHGVEARNVRRHEPQKFQPRHYG